MKTKRSLNARRYGYLIFVLGVIVSLPLLIIFIEPKIQISFAQLTRDRAIALNAAKQNQSVQDFMESVGKSCKGKLPEPLGFKEAPEKFHSYLDELGECTYNGLFSVELEKAQRIATIFAWVSCLLLSILSGLLTSICAAASLFLVRFVKSDLVRWLTTQG